MRDLFYDKSRSVEYNEGRDAFYTFIKTHTEAFSFDLSDMTEIIDAENPYDVSEDKASSDWAAGFQYSVDEYLEAIGR